MFKHFNFFLQVISVFAQNARSEEREKRVVFHPQGKSFKFSSCLQLLKDSYRLSTSAGEKKPQKTFELR